MEIVVANTEEDPLKRRWQAYTRASEKSSGILLQTYKASTQGLL